MNAPRPESGDLDESFPLGDGTADTEAQVICPWCHQPAHIALDPGSGSSQEYMEDCPVCCRAWVVSVKYVTDGTAHVRVEPEDGG